MEISIMGYDPLGAWIKTVSSVKDALAWRNSAGITWIHTGGFDDHDGINALAEEFKIHSLTVEDILDAGQRPKVEEFDNYLFITLKAVRRRKGSPLAGPPGPLPPDPKHPDSRHSDPRHPDPERPGIEPFNFEESGFEELGFEQVSFVITDDTVLTFQEKPGGYFDGIRKRILNNSGRINRMGADYLAYALIDAVVDEYFVVLDSLGAALEEFEDRAADEQDGAFIRDVQKLKRVLLRLRRVIWPLRESLSLLMHLDSSRVSGELEPFLKDLYDHLMRAAETLETYRELITGVVEVNLSAVSNRMNKIMKVLTIISTIFIPLTFIVGVYGMNFHMPELEEPLAYPIVWGIMVIVALGMLIYFRRRHWI
ncbi:MAG: magnesium/cobalt transporter CorA [Treponema sp.]|jgi:magnesium transporter|nr:magnesium/cobalt transporter CorA [Treponema sp.]